MVLELQPQGSKDNFDVTKVPIHSGRKVTRVPIPFWNENVCEVDSFWFQFYSVVTLFNMWLNFFTIVVTILCRLLYLWLRFCQLWLQYCVDYSTCGYGFASVVQLWLHFCVDCFMYCMHHFGTDYTPYHTHTQRLASLNSYSGEVNIWYGHPSPWLHSDTVETTLHKRYVYCSRVVVRTSCVYSVCVLCPFSIPLLLSILFKVILCAICRYISLSLSCSRCM